MLDNSNSELSMFKIERARDKIIKQIGERDILFPAQKPAYPWDGCTKWLSYVFSLPGEHLRSIRLHCDLFLGENTPVVFFSGYNPRQDEIYTWLGAGVDPAHWASEPIVPVIQRPLGGEIGGKYVTQTTLLVQQYVCNLIRIGLADGQSVVEIGAGYGGLAEAILRVRNVRYTIIDLPETLIFSAAFLLTHFPEKRAYIYQPGDSPDQDWEKFDLIFLPSYRADWVRKFPRQDLAINTVSFPEMSREDLKTYGDILADILDGPLMSVNYHGDRNDGIGVTDVLSERFTMTPTPEQIKEGLMVSQEEYADHNFRPTILFLPQGYDAAKLEGVELRGGINQKPFVITKLGDKVKITSFETSSETVE